MKTDQILAEIQEANLSFLLLSQKLLQADFERGVEQLGISAASATLLKALSPAQALRIARTNTLVHRFEMTDDLVFGLITSHTRPASNRPVAAPAAGLLAA